MSGADDFKMSEADAMEEALRHEEMERYADKPGEELEKELEAKGYDEDATLAAILRAHDEVFPPKATVSSLDEARQRKKREGFGRIAPLALVAGVALFVELGGVHVASTYRPPVTTTYPTYVAPPTDQERARATKENGLRLCKLGYYGECRDWLDRAQSLDPGTDADPRVVQARKAIASAASGDSPLRMRDYNSKPPLGPNERPLQRHP
jgi:hypothetical protein